MSGLVAEIRTILGDVKTAAPAAISAVGGLVAMGVIPGTAEHTVIGIVSGVATVAGAIYAALSRPKSTQP